MGVHSDLSVEDLVLRCAVPGELAAWEEFVRRFHRLIATVVLRAAGRMGDSSKQTVDDLIQDTYLRFCADNYRVLRDFEHRHPGAFLGFVKVVASNVVRDHFKYRYSQRRGADQIEGLSDDFDPAATKGSTGSPGAIERAVLIQEIEHNLDFCVSGADHERNRKVFWLYFRVGLSASAIAAMPGMGLTTKGAESLILRLTRELRERMAVPKLQSKEAPSNTGEGIRPAESF
jgi:RNA polymerase sigma-70 factor, ECF subfamily